MTVAAGGLRARASFTSCGILLLAKVPTLTDWYCWSKHVKPYKQTSNWFSNYLKSSTASYFPKIQNFHSITCDTQHEGLNLCSCAAARARPRASLGAVLRSRQAAGGHSTSLSRAWTYFAGTQLCRGLADIKKQNKETEDPSTILQRFKDSSISPKNRRNWRTLTPETVQGRLSPLLSSSLDQPEGVAYPQRNHESVILLWRAWYPTCQLFCI